MPDFRFWVLALKVLRGVAAVAALGGCALFPSAEPEPAAPAASSAAASTPTPGTNHVKENAEVSALLAYYQQLLDLSAEELRREYLDTSKAFARDRSELSRLRLALLMSVPGAAWRDDAKLLALLEGAASIKSPPDSPRRQFVVLLHKLATEHQREQKRADELQQKLDSMLAIERDLRGKRTQRK